MMIFSLLLRMPETIIKTRSFKIISVPEPYIIIVVGHGIGHIKYTYAVCPDTGVTEPYCSCCAGILHRVTGYRKNKINDGSIDDPFPRANTVLQRNAGTAYKHVGSGILNNLHIRQYSVIPRLTCGVNNP